jgi:hypothetical protein
MINAWRQLMMVALIPWAVVGLVEFIKGGK